jgi:hypothetical protein
LTTKLCDEELDVLAQAFLAGPDFKWIAAVVEEPKDILVETDETRKKEYK